jgi:S-disulfanyl-L-cysteine oxidoreductase SoxD
MNPWVGLPLVDLFTYLRESMPKSDPGSLSAQEYADVVAYMLRINGLPAGETPLPGDTTVLRKIRIEPAVENDPGR